MRDALLYFNCQLVRKNSAYPARLDVRNVRHPIMSGLRVQQEQASLRW